MLTFDVKPNHTTNRIFLQFSHNLDLPTSLQQFESSQVPPVGEASVGSI